MHPELEKLVSRGKIEATTAEQLNLLPVGTFCTHKSWGVGKIKEWDRLQNKIIVDFETKKDHAMSMKFAGISLTPIKEESFLAKRFSSADDLKDLSEKNPTSLISLILSSNNNKILLNQLEDMLKGFVIDSGKYKRWWEKTKKLLRENKKFIVPRKRNEFLEMRSDDFDPSEDLISNFKNARDLKGKFKAVESIIKDINAFKGVEEKIQDLMVEISEVSKKSVKIQFIPAIELILIRDELNSKFKSTFPNFCKDNEIKEENSLISVSEILTDNESEVSELLEGLSLTRLRQILKSFPKAFGEEWVSKILNLIPISSLRSISEIANYLNKENEKDSLIKFINKGMQQRSLSSDVLAWICRERKKLSKSIFTPSLSLSVMSSLEADQLNEESAVRSANKLRDIITNDKNLISDLIKDADITVIRNFGSRLNNSSSFDELTRKSLMAKIIKLCSEVKDIVERKDKKEEDFLIVSQESLDKKKADYDKLIKEEIPQNREDIKIARSYGDLRENFEYKSAKEYQRVLMKRQDDWQKELRSAQPMDFSSPDTSKASIGTTITLEPKNKKDKVIKYSILGAWDSDPDKGIISYISQRGKQILNKKVGDLVKFPTEINDKVDEYSISSIKKYKK